MSHFPWHRGDKAIQPLLDGGNRGHEKKPHTDDDYSEYKREKGEIDRKIQLKTESGCNVFTVNGNVVARSYAIGGATAHHYRGMPSKSPTIYFTRLMVSTLEDQRQQFLQDDTNEKDEAKKKKLIIEWIGANDLITVNESPSMLEADNAIKAKIAHYEELIRNGYANFVICNLPDLSLTPRYQKKSAEEQLNAKLCTEYFNRQLEAAVAELKKIHPECNVAVCDVNTKFKNFFEGIKKGGADAEPYKKYINMEYEFEICTDFPVLPGRNKVYLKCDENYTLTYCVTDPCGQRREAAITFDELVRNYDSSLNWPRRIQEVFNEIKKSNSGISKDNKLYNCILGIAIKNGDILPENDIFTPLKETKAFERFQQELTKENKTIEDLGYFPGVNRLFFDDVHPSDDMHGFLFEEVKNFVKKNYRLNVATVDLGKSNRNGHQNHAKDDLDVPQEKPPVTKPMAGLGSENTLPEKDLVMIFLREYLHQYNQEQNGWFGWMRKRNLKWTHSNLTLQEIKDHALESSIYCNRTFKVLKRLGWLEDENGKVNFTFPKCISSAETASLKQGQ